MRQYDLIVNGYKSCIVEREGGMYVKHANAQELEALSDGCDCFKLEPEQGSRTSQPGHSRG